MKDFITAVFAVILVGVFALALAGFVQEITGQSNLLAEYGGKVVQVVKGFWHSLA